MEFTYADLHNFFPNQDTEEAERLLNAAFAVLCYLKPGDTLKTQFANFTKMSEDTLYVHSRQDFNLVLDELEKHNLAKLK